MSLKNVLAVIRGMGMTATYNPAFKEFRIDYKVSDRRWTPESAYFTQDGSDAILTAQAMLSWEVKHG